MLDVDVMQQTGIVVLNGDRIAARDGQVGRIEGPPLLRHAMRGAGERRGRTHGESRGEEERRASKRSKRRRPIRPSRPSLTW